MYVTVKKKKNRVKKQNCILSENYKILYSMLHDYGSTTINKVTVFQCISVA